MRMLLLGILALAAQSAAADGCIAIIGTGDVGGALGPRFAKLGHAVRYGSRTPDAPRVRELVDATGAGAAAGTPRDAAQACRVIVLAVPWTAALDSLAQLGPLDGRIVVDVTNPLGVRDGRVVALEVPGSGAELLQSRAPGARVVKAFNTLNYRIMSDPRLAGGPVSIPLAGDDAAAKAEVAALARALGFEPADVGPLRTARYTEQMAMLYVDLLVRGGTIYEFHLLPRPP